MTRTAVKVSDDKKADYYADLQALKLVPFWEVKGQLVPPEPKTPCLPHHWRFEDAKQHIHLMQPYIDVKGAERRALVLENPGLPGTAQVTKSLFASFQYVEPGETEDSHCHVASAFRFVLEGTGAHTTVAGEKFYLAPGDIVLTPNMTWHEHGNETDSPMIMFDGLDIPLVNHFGASFKGLIEGPHKVSRPVGDGIARYGLGVMQVDRLPRKAGLVSPMSHYPYERVRSALTHMRQSNEWDECHGLKVRYTNPVTGGYAFPTMGLFLQLLPAGFETKPYRSTDEVVYVVAEGRGQTVIGERTIEWGHKDVFVVPSWTRHRHIPDGDVVLFSLSDRPAQEKLGYWREQRSSATVVHD